MEYTMKDTLIHMSAPENHIGLKIIIDTRYSDMRLYYWNIEHDVCVIGELSV